MRLGLFLTLLAFTQALNALPEYALEGDFIPGGMIIGRIGTSPETDKRNFLSDVKVEVNGEPVRVSPEGIFVFGLGRNASGEVELTVTQNEDSSTQRYAVQKREYNIQRVEGVQQKHVEPPAEVMERIANENRKVARARKLDDERLDFAKPFIWPLVGPITGVYGSQRIYNGVPKSPHYGLDIAAPTGTRVVAPAAGVVTLAEPDLYFSGGTLILDHGHGVSSTFIHLHKVLVQVGDKVEQGQAVAQVGATGRATGPHLDWRMNWFSERLDPEVLMRQQNTPMPEQTP